MACGDQDEVAKPTNKLIRRALGVVNDLEKRPCSKDKALSYLVGHATGSTRLDPEMAERQGARMRGHVWAKVQDWLLVPPDAGHRSGAAAVLW